MKITVATGFISTIITSILAFFIIQTVYYSTGKQFKIDLVKKYIEIENLVAPEKSAELNKYLNDNKLNLYIFDKNENPLKRYGIYENLDNNTLRNLAKLRDVEGSYLELELGNYGKYDVYTKNFIQIAIKDNLIIILRNIFYIAVIILIPIIWIVSFIISKIAERIKKKNCDKIH